jgi:hypothetical protein
VNQTNTQNGEEGIQARTKQDTQLAIEKLNNNKAPGTDGIPAELLKHGGQEVINKIQKLMGIIWEGERKYTRGVGTKYYIIFR